MTSERREPQNDVRFWSTHCDSSPVIVVAESMIAGVKPCNLHLKSAFQKFTTLSEPRDLGKCSMSLVRPSVAVA